MKANTVRTTLIATLITVTSALCGLPANAGVQGGGMITFTGAVLAPPFGISFTRAPVVPARGMTVSASGDLSAAQVTFRPEPGNVSSAEVEVSVVSAATPGINPNGHRLVAGCITSSVDNVCAKTPAARYHVGTAGGVLSLQETGDNGRIANDPLIVMVSYH